MYAVSCSVVGTGPIVGSDVTRGEARDMDASLKNKKEIEETKSISKTETEYIKWGGLVHASGPIVNECVERENNDLQFFIQYPSGLLALVRS